MKATAQTSAEVEQVQALLDSYIDAVRALDLDRILACYAPDMVAYDAIAQLEFSGLETYRHHWKMCVDHCQNMIFEPREPVIYASGDVAFGHYLVHCGGTGPDGKECSGWMRATFGARKQNGRWQIVHEHYSAPFDPETNKILSDAKPPVS